MHLLCIKLLFLDIFNIIVFMKKRRFLTILFSTLLLTSCNKYTPPHYDLDDDVTYSTFDEYRLDNLNNLYSQEEDVYAVYLYREDCNECNSLKNSVLGYLSDYKKESRHFKLYLYNTVRLLDENINYLKKDHNYEENKNYMIDNKVNSIEDTIINVVPSLYVIKFNTLIDYYESYDTVKFLFETEFDSRSYSVIEDYYLDSLDDFYTLSDKNYIIYLYYTECPYCFQIRGTIYNYLLKEHDTKIYVFNMYKSSSDEGKENRSKFKTFGSISDSEFEAEVQNMLNNKVSTLSETIFKYVPSLYFVNDNKLTDFMHGSGNIKSYINSLK